jgi:hypothetical protein
MSVPEQGFQGTLNPLSAGTPFNAISFITKSLINGMATATMVRVVAVNNSGGLSPVGLVDVQPLLNQQDGFGNPTPHNIIHNCPYIRIQGGSNAIILDPQVGDTGLAVFTDKDSSKIIANQQANNGGPSQLTNPDSGRRYSFSDGMYFGGFLNGTPTQYVQFNSSGITITSPNSVTINAPTINLNGVVNTSSTMHVATSVTSPLLVGTTNVTFGGKSGVAHTHGGVTTGGGNTGAPN